MRLCVPRPAVVEAGRFAALFSVVLHYVVLSRTVCPGKTSGVRHRSMRLCALVRERVAVAWTRTNRTPYRSRCTYSTSRYCTGVLICYGYYPVMGVLRTRMYCSKYSAYSISRYHATFRSMPTAALLPTFSWSPGSGSRHSLSQRLTLLCQRRVFHPASAMHRYT